MFSHQTCDVARHGNMFSTAVVINRDSSTQLLGRQLAKLTGKCCSFLLFYGKKECVQLHLHYNEETVSLPSVNTRWCCDRQPDQNRRGIACTAVELLHSRHQLRQRCGTTSEHGSLSQNTCSPCRRRARPLRCSGRDTHNTATSRRNRNHALTPQQCKTNKITMSRSQPGSKNIGIRRSVRAYSPSRNLNNKNNNKSSVTSNCNVGNT